MTLVAAPERRVRLLAFRLAAAPGGAAAAAGGLSGGSGTSAFSARPLLLALSDVGGGGAFSLEPLRATNWAGCMYPPGFEVVEDNLPYLEAEDELDTAVDANNEPLPWDDADAHFTEDADVEVEPWQPGHFHAAAAPAAQSGPGSALFSARLPASLPAAVAAAAASTARGPLARVPPLCVEPTALRRHRTTSAPLDSDGGSTTAIGGSGSGALDELLAPRGFAELLPAARAADSAMDPAATKKNYSRAGGRAWGRLHGTY
jgi:hypothetical protein